MPTQLSTLDVPFDELNVGDTLESRGRTVTEADIVAYAALSGDWTPLHTDAVAAAAGPFGARIAHGGLTISISTGLEFSLLGDAENVLAFYGMDRVRFLKPVFIGDTIHLRGEILALEPKDDARGIVTVRQELVNQDGDVVAILDKRTLYRRAG
jgi:acyl dehydratase